MTNGFSGDHRTSLPSAGPGTLGFALRGFLYDREICCSPRTIGYYEDKLGQFIGYLDGCDVQRPGQITQDHVRGFLDDAKQRGNNPGGVHAKARAVKAFLRWCVLEDLVDAKVPARIKMPKVPKAMIQPFSLAQVEQLLQTARDGQLPERDVAILLTMLDTGIRAQEVCNLTLADIEGERLLVNGKGSKQRWVRISPRTKRSIWGWQRKMDPESPWLFHTRTGEQMTVSALELLFKRLKKRGGIEGVRCSPHTVRHTTALEWIRDGGNAFELKKLLGHTSLFMTNQYVAMCDEDVAQAHRKHGLVEKLSRRRK